MYHQKPQYQVRVKNANWIKPRNLMAPKLVGWIKKAETVSKWMMKYKKSPEEAAQIFHLRPDTIIKMSSYYLRTRGWSDIKRAHKQINIS